MTKVIPRLLHSRQGTACLRLRLCMITCTKKKVAVDARSGKPVIFDNSPLYTKECVNHSLLKLTAVIKS